MSFKEDEDWDEDALQRVEPDIDDNARAQAKNNPNGHVFVIAGSYTEDDFTPPGAIFGYWGVDENGEIIEGSFVFNDNFRDDLNDRRFKNIDEYNEWANSN